jgi:hypothetical protein
MKEAKEWTSEVKEARQQNASKKGQAGTQGRNLVESIELGSSLQKSDSTLLLTTETSAMERRVPILKQESR